MLIAITDRRLYGATEDACRRRLLELTRLWAAHGIAFILLREKNLSLREQLELARAMAAIVRAAPGNGQRTRLLVHSRPDLALAAGTDGVHLPSGPGALTPDEVRTVFAARQAPCTVSLSCHTQEELARACDSRPDLILFAPVFEKSLPGEQILPGAGLDRLRDAIDIAAPIPVLALGGITAANAAQCLAAGAHGIAAIRLMLEPAEAWQALA